MTEAENLMMEIVKCGMDCKELGHPCHSIWESQGCKAVGDFHLPEPWNGSIENARLMFLGINPRHNAGELFPRTGNPWWMVNGEFNCSRIVDFFSQRFSSREGYVIGVPNGSVRVRVESGMPSKKVYRNAGGVYWKYLHEIARLVLGNDCDLGQSVTQGSDYVMSEVVHCKTINEKGVSISCFRHCRDKWLSRMMGVACNVEYIVVVGGKAKKNIASTFSIANPQWWKWYSVSWNHREYKVLFVYHSNARRSYRKSVSDVFAANRKAGIGLSEIPVAASAGETAIREYELKNESSSESLVNPKTERNTAKMEASKIIERLNGGIVLDSNKRECGKWQPTSNEQTLVAYNIGTPPRGPKARKIIMRLKPVAQEPSKLEVAFYIGANNPRLRAFKDLYDEKKTKELWFEESGGRDLGVKSIIPLATVGESEWQDIVAGEMDRLFEKYAMVVGAEP